MSTLLSDSAYPSVEFCEASANEDCNIVQLLRSMATLRRLDLDGKALQHLDVGDVAACLPSVCPMKHLTVSIDFGNSQDLLVAFCIFKSSPFLQHLKVSSSYYESRIISDGFWKREDDFGFKFDHLQTVEVDGLTGSESELKFIEFLFSKAPVLKTLEVHFGNFAEDKVTAVRELVRFRRISPNAELILDE